VNSGVGNYKVSCSETMSLRSSFLVQRVPISGPEGKRKTRVAEEDQTETMRGKAEVGKGKYLLGMVVMVKPATVW